MRILQAAPAHLQVLIYRYALMPAVDDLVVNVGGLERFEALYLPVLERLADRVQELPLQKAAFADLGGALTCAVRAGTLAVRTCDATIFSPTATAAERLANDAHYRWLAYCAVLASVYLMAAASVDVVHESASGVRERYSWADDRHLVEWRPTYLMAWVDRPQFILTRLSPLLAPFFFPGQFAHLPRALVSDFGAALNPGLVTSSAEPALARVVRQSIEKVIADEKATTAAWVSALASQRAEATPLEVGATEFIDPETGEIRAQAATSHEFGHVRESQETESPQLIAAREWIVGLAASRDLWSHATLMPDKRLVLTRQALNFGRRASEVFKMLDSAGLVDSRKPDEATLIAAAGEIYTNARNIQEAK